jgi:hypothetical protein
MLEEMGFMDWLTGSGSSATGSSATAPKLEREEDKPNVEAQMPISVVVPKQEGAGRRHRKGRKSHKGSRKAHHKGSRKAHHKRSHKNRKSHRSAHRKSRRQQ